MGNSFVMSMRFNKCRADDFGLIQKDADTAIDPKDNSVWIKTALYDFGWGKENGFYKSPLPNFDTLFELALHSKNREDMFGAAAVILEKFPDELLNKCEIFMKDEFSTNEFEKMVNIFKLDLPKNRCAVIGKTYKQIQNDHIRWKRVSEIANSIKGRQTK